MSADSNPGLSGTAKVPTQPAELGRVLIAPYDYFAGSAPDAALAANGQQLLDRVNPLLERFLAAYPGFAVRVDSGYRTPERNAQIPGAARNSKHLSAQAVDVGDVARELAIWCLINKALLRELCLWCEDPRATQTWMHFQSVSPKSGARFFIPNPEWAKKLRGEPLSAESIRRWAAPPAQATTPASR